MYDGYLISILHGALLSIQVALGALVVAIVLGLAGATAKLSSHKPLIWLGGIYSTIIRGIPDLVLMLLIFYGGQIGLNVLLESFGYTDYVEINPFAAGLITIGFIYGTRDVKDRWDGTGQRGAVQHHDDLVRVGGQGAAHRRGQHDATQNL